MTHLRYHLLREIEDALLNELKVVKLLKCPEQKLKYDINEFIYKSVCIFMYH